MHHMETVKSKAKQNSQPHFKPNCCRNCGQYGHLYKDCTHPITSFGVICFRINPNTSKPEYIMIQRKDSLSFMEFIRGKYDLSQVHYIGQLLSAMTHREREMLVMTPFEQLWNHVWYQPFMPRHTNEFEQAKGKFESLRNGYLVEGGSIVALEKLLQLYTSPFQDPEWGFPKGRRRLREEDVDCALREFSEETGISEENLHVVSNIPPFEEIFFGTNSVLYRHVYYVAKMEYHSKYDVVVDPTNVNQVREVRDIQWFTAEDVIEHIRGHNQERKQLFMQAHSRILSTFTPA